MREHIDLIIYTDDGVRVPVGEADMQLNPISEEMEIVNVEIDPKYKDLVRDRGESYSLGKPKDPA